MLIEDKIFVDQEVKKKILLSIHVGSDFIKELTISLVLIFYRRFADATTFKCIYRAVVMCPVD